MGRPNKGTGTVGPKRPCTNNSGSNTNGDCKSSSGSKKK